jgi:hypothetical protein
VHFALPGNEIARGVSEWRDWGSWPFSGELKYNYPNQQCFNLHNVRMAVASVGVGPSAPSALKQDQAIVKPLTL